MEAKVDLPSRPRAPAGRCLYSHEPEGFFPCLRSRIVNLPAPPSFPIHLLWRGWMNGRRGPVRREQQASRHDAPRLGTVAPPATPVFVAATDHISFRRWSCYVCDSVIARKLRWIRARPGCGRQGLVLCSAFFFHSQFTPSHLQTPPTHREMTRPRGQSDVPDSSSNPSRLADPSPLGPRGADRPRCDALIEPCCWLGCAATPLPVIST